MKQLQLTTWIRHFDQRSIGGDSYVDTIRLTKLWLVGAVSITIEHLCYLATQKCQLAIYGATKCAVCVSHKVRMMYQILNYSPKKLFSCIHTCYIVCVSKLQLSKMQSLHCNRKQKSTNNNCHWPYVLTAATSCIQLLELKWNVLFSCLCIFLPEWWASS